MCARSSPHCHAPPCLPWPYTCSMAAVISRGQCMMSFAYALRVSPALANVLGKVYTPIAAFGARCILPKPETATTWVEYFAIIILTLASLTFGYLQEHDVEKGFKSASVTAMLCVMGSAACSAFGSLASERILKGERAKYIIQKVRLDFGSILTSLFLLPLISVISSRAIDSVWISRPMNGVDECAACTPEVHGPFPHWPWEENVGEVCGQPECTGPCACVPGLVAGWNHLALFMALVVNVGHGWLIGKITKSFSTVHRAIADAFSTLLLYWVGDPMVFLLLNGTGFTKSISDSALDMVSFIVPLSTVTFMVAANAMRTNAEMRGALMGNHETAGSVGQMSSTSGSTSGSQEVSSGLEHVPSSLSSSGSDSESDGPSV
mmetsp:Transcript_56980/g.146659  ORF Transcript_56980/g.146659 Transcript_56980/m.146659 type:complete len:378 (+) Transcript_56980:1824-2957(+)